MSRGGIEAAIEASHARMLALANEMVALHARMPDPGADSPPEELLLLAAIEAESAEMRRLEARLRTRARLRRVFVVVGWIVLTVAIFAAVALFTRP